MGLLLLIPGIILWTCGPWFEDQAQVGEILTYVGAGLLVLQVVIALVIASAASSKAKRW